MRRSVILLVGMLIVLTSVTCLGQTQEITSRNTVFVEFGGASGRYALNYGRVFRPTEKLKFNLNLGFSLWQDKPIEKVTWHPVVPIEFTAFYGKSKHHMEIGAGITSYTTAVSEFDSDVQEIREGTAFGYYLPTRIGYRYQKPQGGFFYRIGYTPFFKAPSSGRNNWVFEPRFAAISIGKSF